MTQSLVNHDMRHQPSGTLLLTSSAERIVLSSDPSQVREVVREDPRKETQPAQVDQPTGDVLGRGAVIPRGRVPRGVPPGSLVMIQRLSLITLLPTITKST